MTREQLKECLLETADAFKSGRIRWIKHKFFEDDVALMSELPVDICACAVGGLTATAIQKGYLNMNAIDDDDYPLNLFDAGCEMESIMNSYGLVAGELEAVNDGSSLDETIAKIREFGDSLR